ncbi:MAG: hypothetical protein Fur002_07460 [Anaerolineales bacterium]
MTPKRDLTRADLARQRRAQNAVKELQKTTQRARAPIARAPRAASNFTQPAVSRRYQQVALGIPQVAARGGSALNGQPTNRQWKRVSLGSALILGLLIVLALTLPYFNVPSVTVLGNTRLTREEISSAAAVIGQSIFTVQPQEVETRLRTNYPELLSVKAKVYLPNHVYLTVEERQPVILWQRSEAYTWIDSNGVAFRPHGQADGLIFVSAQSDPPPGAPFAENPLVPPPYMQPELAQAILTLAPLVPPDTSMTYDSVYGLGWNDSHGWQVFFGARAYDMPLKMRVYESLAASLSARGIAPTFISVVYPEAPYYRTAAEVQYKPVSENSGQ